MCKPEKESKEDSSIEKSLNLSLIFFPGKRIPYSIDTINDNLMVKGWRTFDIDKISEETRRIMDIEGIDDTLLVKKTIPYIIDIINDSLIIYFDGDEKYRGKFTDEQYLELEKRISVLSQTYDWSKKFANDAWGCVLTIDNQIYYQTNWYAFNAKPQPDGKSGPPILPEEIKLLIGYILGLSPIPIEVPGGNLIKRNESEDYTN